MYLFVSSAVIFISQTLADIANTSNDIPSSSPKSSHMDPGLAGQTFSKYMDFRLVATHKKISEFIFIVGRAFSGNQNFLGIHTKPIWIYYDPKSSA